MPVRFWRTDGEYNIYVDTVTGVERRVKLASEAQMKYLNSLREKLDKKPLKGVQEAWRASQNIEKLLAKTQTNQQKLL